jgi:hypothetical protein
VLIRGLGAVDLWKKPQRSKISWYCLFKQDSATIQLTLLYSIKADCVRICYFRKKGTVPRIFRHSVFSSNNPPKDPDSIHGLKPFPMWLRICRCNVYTCICFCYGSPLKGMTADNCFREGFRGLIDNVESASAVSMKPRNSLLRSHWKRGSRSFQTIISNISAKFEERKKTVGRKSRDTVPLRARVHTISQELKDKRTHSL